MFSVIPVSADDQLILVELPGVERRSHVRKKTVGILDMGGASLQIAMEIPHHLCQHPTKVSLVYRHRLICTQADQHIHTENTYTHTHMQACTRTYTHTFTPSHKHVNTHTHTHSSTDARFKLHDDQVIVLCGFVRLSRSTLSLW